MVSQRQLNKQRMRAHIVETASALIKQHSVSGTTSRQIANAAGLSYQTLYNHFPHKHLILKELLRASKLAWSSEIEQSVKKYESGVVEQLVRLTQIGLLQATGPDAELWRSYLQDQIKHGIQEDDAFSPLGHEHCYGLLKIAQGMGHIQKEADLHLIAHTVYCLIDYATLNFFLRPTSLERALVPLRQQFGLLLNPHLA